MWTLVSPLIDETSREKFLFYGGNDYQDPGGLVDYIAPENIPAWLGGEAETAIPEGGLVPKSFYMSVEEFVKDQSPGPHLLEESFYHSTSLSKGQVHEGLIHITDRGCVITWDFDVMRHDVIFTVYRLRDPPQLGNSGPKSPLPVSPPPVATNSSANGGGAAAPAAGASGGGGGGVAATFVYPNKSAVSSEPSSTSSCIGKSWREGVEFYKVENSIVCHDGESIQGSHVTSHPGTYVLQWKFFDLARSTAHLSPLDDVIDSITAHKAKVMYYYETLNSSDYKGSMTSLQSCQSGFSTISKASGKHSTSGVSSGVSSTSHSDRLGGLAASSAASGGVTIAVDGPSSASADKS